MPLLGAERLQPRLGLGPRIVGSVQRRLPLARDVAERVTLALDQCCPALQLGPARPAERRLLAPACARRSSAAAVAAASSAAS
ncbi:MAG: hypothetical protein R3D25_09355 [Geminicoccaceae bacterium]